jgi:hypothetical protein
LVVIYEGKLWAFFVALATTGTAILFLFSFTLRRIENISFWHPVIIFIQVVQMITATGYFWLFMDMFLSDGLSALNIFLLMYALLIAYLTHHSYKKSLAIYQDNKPDYPEE